MFERFTKDARAVVLAAARLGAELGADKAGPDHLLLALAGAEGSGQRILADYQVTAADLRTALTRSDRPAGLTEEELDALRAVGIDTDEVFRRIKETFGAGALDEPSMPLRRRGRLGGLFDPRAKKVLELALREAIALGHKQIRSAHLLLALLRNGVSAPLQTVLARHGVNYDDARARARTLLDGAA
jgi:ATP-dependent Clp protease ATP-binding subunit ClpA